MGASAIWTRTNRYKAEVYKKQYKTLLIVSFSIPHFCQERKMINLIDKTKLVSEKQFYDKFLNFWIQVQSQIRTNGSVYLMTNSEARKLGEPVLMMILIP